MLHVLPMPCRISAARWVFFGPRELGQWHKGDRRSVRPGLTVLLVSHWIEGARRVSIYAPCLTWAARCVFAPFSYVACFTHRTGEPSLPGFWRLHEYPPTFAAEGRGRPERYLGPMLQVLPTALRADPE